MESDLLTTGHVAKLCGVTADTVLKWIKKGRLAAGRTAGGHYRVSREACDALRAEHGCRAPAPVRAGSSRVPMRCWEFFSRQGAPAETCTQCFVYRARAERCYEVADLGSTVGHQRRHCQTSCENCAFYRACQGMAAAVLVITRDEPLIERLEDEADPNKLNLRFARSGYECSTMIDSLRPAVVVLDGALPEAREGGLADSLMSDPRIAGARVFVSRRKGREARGERLGAEVLAPPITAAQLQEIAGSLAQGRQVPGGS